jgi:hypothetical protein
VIDHIWRQERIKQRDISSPKDLGDHRIQSQVNAL